MIFLYVIFCNSQKMTENTLVRHDGFLKVHCETPTTDVFEIYKVKKVKLEIMGFEKIVQINYDELMSGSFCKWLERIEEYLSLNKVGDLSIKDKMIFDKVLFIEEACYKYDELYLRIEDNMQSFFIILDCMPCEYEQIIETIRHIHHRFRVESVGGSFMNIGREEQFKCDRETIAICCKEIIEYLDAFKREYKNLHDFYVCIGSFSKDLFELDKMLKKCRGLYGSEKLKLEKLKDSDNQIALKYAGPLI